MGVYEIRLAGKVPESFDSVEQVHYLNQLLSLPSGASKRMTQRSRLTLKLFLYPPGSGTRGKGSSTAVNWRAA